HRACDVAIACRAGVVDRLRLPVRRRWPELREIFGRGGGERVNADDVAAGEQQSDRGVELPARDLYFSEFGFVHHDRSRATARIDRPYSGPIKRPQAFGKESRVDMKQKGMQA